MNGTIKYIVEIVDFKEILPFHNDTDLPYKFDKDRQEEIKRVFDKFPEPDLEGSKKLLLDYLGIKTASLTAIVSDNLLKSKPLELTLYHCHQNMQYNFFGEEYSLF
ncbi:hypothetical protein KY321_01760 [Candidatus Woesearchaeota archaeon]|nr:hypothetical protein [Candidatus Woesearchaeota archaeon]